MGATAKQEWIRTQKFGLELEGVGITRKQAAEAAQSVVGGSIEHVTGNNYDPWVVTDSQGRKWQFISDGSLTDAGFDHRVEMVTPPLTMIDMEDLQAVIRALRVAGLKKSAHGGLHYVPEFFMRQKN